MVQARKAYVHLAIEIMDKNNIAHEDPDKEKLEKEWEECVAGELREGHSENDILAMKLA